MKTVTITKTLYKFDELSDKAKETARDWYRQFVFDDNNDWDCIYEDAATIAEMLGIELRQKPVKLMNGGTRYEPAIYFSGFSSQGDGACFEGTYSYRKGSVKAIKAHAPEDKELHRIAVTLFEIQRKAFYRITANITHHGAYSHSGCIDIDVDCEDSDMYFEADVCCQCLRDFADWIYDQLRKEYEYQNSDESIDENITCNDYTFTEEGKRDD